MGTGMWYVAIVVVLVGLGSVTAAPAAIQGLLTSKGVSSTENIFIKHRRISASPLFKKVGSSEQSRAAAAFKGGSQSNLPRTAFVRGNAKQTNVASFLKAPGSRVGAERTLDRSSKGRVLIARRLPQKLATMAETRATCEEVFNECFLSNQCDLDTVGQSDECCPAFECVPEECLTAAGNEVRDACLGASGGGGGGGGGDHSGETCEEVFDACLRSNQCDLDTVGQSDECCPAFECVPEECLTAAGNEVRDACLGGSGGGGGDSGETCEEVFDACLRSNQCDLDTVGQSDECCPAFECVPEECLTAAGNEVRDACLGGGGGGGGDSGETCEEVFDACLRANQCDLDTVGQSDECCPAFECVPEECLTAAGKEVRDGCLGGSGSGGDDDSDDSDDSEDIDGGGDSDDGDDDGGGDDNGDGGVDSGVSCEEEQARCLLANPCDSDTLGETDDCCPAIECVSEECLDANSRAFRADCRSRIPTENDCVATDRVFGNDTTLMDHMSLHLKTVRRQRIARTGTLLCLSLSSDRHVCTTANHLLMWKGEYLSMREVCAEESRHCFTAADTYTGVKWNSREEGYLPLGSDLFLTPHSTNTGRRVYYALAGRVDWLLYLLTT